MSIDADNELDKFVILVSIDDEISPKELETLSILLSIELDTVSIVWYKSSMEIDTEPDNVFIDADSELDN